ncbi:mavicyanin-like [Rutidosis leptorrhynchoides]|uniref:mavicyanin-like n=1 Tax=Rutidosis leptorrhynchoides TaxID=125765 RepID=UPI003A9A21F5
MRTLKTHKMRIYIIGVVLLMIFLSCSVPCLAKVYTVGDSSGWSLGVDYSTWTSDKTFAVGDTLVFNYGSSHSVDEVTSSDYGTCNVGNSIASYTSGPTTIALNTTGTHYFVCGVVGHCSGGMKLSVPVTGGGGATPATPGTGTSPITKPAPTPPTSTTPGSVPASSETISPNVAVAFSLVCLMFKFILV